MLLRDLEDFKKWKKSMENKTERFDLELKPRIFDKSPISHGMQNTPPSDPNKINIVSFVEHSTVLLRSNGPNGLYYNANVIKTIAEEYEQELIEEKSLKNYWRDKAENVETAYNLQKKALENADKKVEDLNEKIKILSDALTRSKMNERGKLILISRLKNQLNKHGRSKR